MISYKAEVIVREKLKIFRTGMLASIKYHYVFYPRTFNFEKISVLVCSLGGTRCKRYLCLTELEVFPEKIRIVYLYAN